MRADEKERAESAGGTFSESAFSERGSAARYAKVLALLPAKAASELPGYLAASCNPDRAVLQLEVLLQRHPAESLTAFVSSALALRASVALFSCSPWLGQTLLQNPDLLRLFARPQGLAAERLAEDFREQFARFRMRSPRDAAAGAAGALQAARICPHLYPRVAWAGVAAGDHRRNLSTFRCDDRAGAGPLRERAARPLPGLAAAALRAGDGCMRRALRCCRWASWAATN